VDIEYKDKLMPLIHEQFYKDVTGIIIDYCTVENNELEYGCKPYGVTVPHHTLMRWYESHGRFHSFKYYYKAVDKHVPNKKFIAQYSCKWNDYTLVCWVDDLSSVLCTIIKNNTVISFIYDPIGYLQPGDSNIYIYQIKDDILICNSGVVKYLIFIKCTE
jgi:hypothetical protein